MLPKSTIYGLANWYKDLLFSFKVQFFPMQQVPETILCMWLLKLNLRVSSKLIDRQMKSHPHYPSLVSITDTLDYLGIEHLSIEINEDQLHEIPTPFLAHLKNNGGKFVIVENRDKLEEIYPGFFQHWSGVIVAAEKVPAWHHKENSGLLWNEKRAAAKRNICVALVILASLAATILATSWRVPVLIMIALAGVFISRATALKDLGIENKIADKVCGKEADCDSVIHSKGGKLPFNIGWSDIGLIWFFSLLTVLILSSFAGFSAAILDVLSLLSVAVIPFTIFSIYYQWRVAKKWCRLCLINVALLCAQLALLTPLHTISRNAIEITGILFMVTTLSLVSIAWFSLSSLIRQNNNQQTQIVNGIKFKRNRSVLAVLLENQQKANITPLKTDLQLGNKKAVLQITVACSPYCRPCATMHEELHDVIEKHGDKMGLTVKFTIPAQNIADKRTRAVQHIHQYIEEHTCDMDDEERILYTREILHQWFKLMDLEKFSAKYPCKEIINVEDALNAHDDWVTRNNILYTPTVFINGRKMPAPYRINDLPLMINELTELILEQESLETTKPVLV